MIMAASDNASRWADNVAEKRSYAERHGYGFHMFINLRAPGRTVSGWVSRVVMGAASQAHGSALARLAAEPAQPASSP